MMLEKMKSEVERAIKASALNRLPKGKLVGMVLDLMAELAAKETILRKPAYDGIRVIEPVGITKSIEGRKNKA